LRRGKIMILRKMSAVFALSVAAVVASVPAIAQEWPMVPGDYWEVTGIDIKDGGGLKYAQWLASEWKDNMEFSKSKGWIKDYMIFSNVYGRANEPDLYLITVTESVASGAEGQRRAEEFRAWKKKTIEQMQSESGNRAEYREVMSDSLLQELKFR
jgi:hypothetical protein